MITTLSCFTGCNTAAIVPLATSWQTPGASPPLLGAEYLSPAGHPGFGGDWNSLRLRLPTLLGKFHVLFPVRQTAHVNEVTMSQHGILAPKLVRFGGQNYGAIHHECRKTGKLFVDPLFPADDSSLFREGNRPSFTSQAVEWKRPIDLCENPRLFVDGAESTDVKQGRVGNCWFVASCSVLANHRSLLGQVVPEGQEFEEHSQKKYSGAFHFRFWEFGQWTDVRMCGCRPGWHCHPIWEGRSVDTTPIAPQVVIDDRLPTIDGELIFVHSQEKGEFWASLLEKAYAKLHGWYAPLRVSVSAV